MVDYSRTVLGDIFWFIHKKCVFCSQRSGNLSRVAVSAYSGHDWYYFHDQCLGKVVDNPEQYAPFVDYANEIKTEIKHFENIIGNKTNIESLRKKLRQ